MQQVLGYSALMTGFAWLAASVISAALAGLSQMLVTRASAKLVMAAGMILIGAGILRATQVPVHEQFWADLAGPFLVTGAGTAFTFIPMSIGALAGMAERDARMASRLLNTAQQLGGRSGWRSPRPSPRPPPAEPGVIGMIIWSWIEDQRRR
jgi:hypothetical protein